MERHRLISEPFNGLAPSGQALVDLVSYQADSIVSRTLMKSAGGSLTLFAFDAGQGLSEHSTPHEAALLILDGTADVTVGDHSVAVAAGQFIRLPARVPHALEAVQPFKMLLAMFREPA